MKKDETSRYPHEIAIKIDRIKSRIAILSQELDGLLTKNMALSTTRDIGFMAFFLYQPGQIQASVDINANSQRMIAINGEIASLKNQLKTLQRQPYKKEEKNYTDNIEMKTLIDKGSNYKSHFP